MHSAEKLKHVFLILIPGETSFKSVKNFFSLVYDVLTYIFKQFIIVHGDFINSRTGLYVIYLKINTKI